ncbi:MAG: hypothetical protein LH473_06685 [Chitinophagales bacterium]|nr:hypothetical protein [Chitinophagales bacterium]
MLLLAENVSGIFVLMKHLKFLTIARRCCLLLISIVSLFSFPTKTFAQQAKVPIIARPPQPITAVYQLDIVPVAGGKTFTIYNKTKVWITFKNGKSISGKVKGVGKDSINIDYRNYAVRDIDELKYNPGSALGAAAAIATAVGVAAIALTADGGKDNVRDGTENAIFYTGVTLSVAGGITLIPTYFIKKRFSKHQYDFNTVQMN